MRRTLIAAAVTAALCTGAATAGYILTRPEVTPPVAVSQVASGSGPEDGPPRGMRRMFEPPVPVAAARGGCVDVPILVYHYIRVDTNLRNPLGYNLSVWPAEFQEQMDWLRIAGGHPVTLEQLYSAMHRGPALPAHAVVLTFDDGYDDFATTAVPILVHDGFVATDFVVSGFVDRPAYMSAQQILQVAAMGMVIGAHTVHHVNLDALSPQLAQIEIDVSKESLQRLVGRPVLDFAYPYGDVDAQVAALVAQAGFRDAVTMQYGRAQCASQPYLLRRIRVTGSDTLPDFAAEAGVAAPPADWADPALAGYHRAQIVHLPR